MRTSQWSDAAVGFGLTAAGAFVFALARRLPQGPDPSAPGPGVAPGALGLILITLGIIIAATAVLRQPAMATDPAAAADDRGQRKLWIAAGLLAGCVILFEPAGFMLATFAFLLAGFTLLGGADWRAAAPAAAISAGAMWLFFTKLLGVGLPYGLIGEILFK
jgi:putative tricarboxylic transport membrane protein